MKTALITGGSRGLGRDAALRLAERGTDLVITYKQSEEKARAVVQHIRDQGLRATALQLDVGDMAQIGGFRSRLEDILQAWDKSGLDILVNNAGIGAHALISQTSEEMIDTLFHVHFKGAFFLTQELLPVLNDGGRIINISSGLTRFTVPGYAAYAAMKGAVEIFTSYLAKELGDRGITANLVAPGAIDNDFNKEAFTHNPRMKEYIASQTALGRVGKSEDIGGVVAYLCSDDAGWITGQRLEASGGIFI